MQKKILVITLLFVFKTFLALSHAQFVVERDKLADPQFEPVLKSNKVLYVKNNRLFFKVMKSKAIAISNKGALRSYDMVQFDKNIWVVWSQKISPNKDGLFLRISKDNGKSWLKPQNLYSDSLLPLVKIKVDWDTKDIILSVQDEKNRSVEVFWWMPNQKVPYRFVVSDPSFSTLFFHDIAFTKKGIVVFCAVKKAQSNTVQLIEYIFPASEHSKLPKKTFVIKATPAIGYIKSGNIGDQEFIVVKYVTNDKTRLSLFHRVRANEFKEVILCRDEDVARAEFKVLAKNKMLVVYSSEIPKKTKQRIFAVLIDFFTNKKPTLQRIRLDNTYPNTTAWLPVVEKKGKEILVIWEDTRNIRSNVYFAYSNNLASDWIIGHYPLSSKRKFAFRPKISSDNQNFYVTWLEWEDDARKVADIVISELSDKSLKKVLILKEREYPLENKKNRLRLRIKEYWTALQEKNYRKSYTFFDPFYRAVVSYEAYAAPLGHIEYLAWSIDNINVVGNEGVVKASVKYKIKNLPLTGKLYSSDVRNGTIKDLWIFVDGDWYKKFIDYLSGGSSVIY